MTFSEVMIYFDYNMQNVARALKISRATVKRWKSLDAIPMCYQLQLHALTGAKLAADLSCLSAEPCNGH